MRQKTWFWVLLTVVVAEGGPVLSLTLLALLQGQAVGSVLWDYAGHSTFLLIGFGIVLAVVADVVTAPWSTIESLVGGRTQRRLIISISAAFGFFLACVTLEAIKKQYIQNDTATWLDLSYQLYGSGFILFACTVVKRSIWEVEAVEK